MSDIAIKVENISKKYLIGENKSYPTLRDKLARLPTQLFKAPKQEQEFWALRGVSFAVKRGEVVGIIGRNGAGKSTLLKILARITEPTEGQVTMYGRVASMLEVGTGFNPELTGRENIYLNGAIIGMTKAEIKAKFDEIVEFSGVGKFLDTPVKHYSSGMYVRLAFAVAAHLDADILLVDEVLAVGDAEFQKRCLGKMNSLATNGKTIILVSHDLSNLENYCNKLIWIDMGKMMAEGGPTGVFNQYTAYLQNQIRSNKHLNLGNNFSLKQLSIKKIIKKNSDLLILLEYSILKNMKQFQLVLHIKNSKGTHVLSTSDSDIDTSILVNREVGQYHAKIKIHTQDFAPGTYRIYLAGGIPDRDLLFDIPGPSFEIPMDKKIHQSISSGRKSAALIPIINWYR